MRIPAAHLALGTLHDFSWDGACDAMPADFVARGTTKALDTTPYIREVVVPPPFRLND